MIIEKIGTGNTTEQAYENAKVLLAAPEEAELHHEILQEAKKKLFGLKIEPAKVRVWYEKEDPKPAPAKKPAPARKPAEKSADKPAQEKKPAPQNQPKAAEPRKQNPQGGKKNHAQSARKDAPKKDAAPKAEAAPEKAAPAPKAEDVYVDVPLNENDVAVKFLRMIAAGMKIETCDITVQKNETTKEYMYSVSCGDDNGVLIGRRGETLDAIQYLLRLTENKGMDEERHRKVTVNVGDYREKQIQNLRAEAQRTARKVLKYGKNTALEPMSAYERRIIHTAVQGIEGVTSHSVGSESNRRVIISLEEGVQPTNPGRDYGNSRRSGGGRRDGNYRQKREPYKPSVTREPRKDSAGALYGKIEIPAKNDEE